MKTIVYVGSLPSGSVRDIRTGIEHSFEKGKPFTVSDTLAEQIIESGEYQQHSEKEGN